MNFNKAIYSIITYVNNGTSNFLITGNAIGFYFLATYLEARNKAYKEFLGPKKFLS